MAVRELDEKGEKTLLPQRLPLPQHPLPSRDA